MRNHLSALREAMELRTGSDLGKNEVEFVRVHEGRLHVRNGRMWASIPCAGDLEFVAHADTLFRVLDRMPHASIVETTNKRLTVRHAGGHAYVKALPVERWSMVHWRGPAPLRPFDGAAMVRAFKRLKPFISDNAFYQWSTGVQVAGSIMMATNNVIFAVLGCTALPWKGLVPTWLVDFVLAQDTPPDTWSIDTCLSFGWNTSGLLVTSMVPGDQFPEAAQSLVRAPCPPDAWLVTPPFKAAVARIAAMVEDTTGLEIRPDSIVATASEVLDLEEQVTSPVSEPRRFGAHSLAKVLAVAERFEVDSKVAKWRDPDGLFGVLAGRA